MEDLSERTQEILKAAGITELYGLVGGHASDIFHLIQRNLAMRGNPNIPFDEMRKAAEEVASLEILLKYFV